MAPLENVSKLCEACSYGWTLIPAVARSWFCPQCGFDSGSTASSGASLDDVARQIERSARATGIVATVLAGNEVQYTCGSRSVRVKGTKSTVVLTGSGVRRVFRSKSNSSSDVVRAIIGQLKHAQ